MLVALRILVLIGMVVCGFQSVGLFMGMVGENNSDLVTSLYFMYFVSALIFGVTFARHWYLSLGVAWLPILLFPEFLIGAFTGGNTDDGTGFMLSPLAALAGGYIGSRVYLKSHQSASSDE